MNCIEKLRHFVLSFVIIVGIMGCATSYNIHTKPEGASVYYLNTETQEKFFLGTTPLTYSKSSLPERKAFMLVVNKEGFKPIEFPMASTDESKTMVNINLKPDDRSSNHREFNDVLRKLFEAQKTIYERRYHAAIISLDQLASEHPDLAQVYVMKGTCYFMLGEKKTAVKEWKEALRLDPENADLNRFLQENKISLDEAAPGVKK